MLGNNSRVLNIQKTNSSYIEYTFVILKLHKHFNMLDITNVSVCKYIIQTEYKMCYKQKPIQIFLGGLLFIFNRKIAQLVFPVVSSVSKYRYRCRYESLEH